MAARLDIMKLSAAALHTGEPLLVAALQASPLSTVPTTVLPKTSHLRGIVVLMHIPKPSCAARLSMLPHQCEGHWRSADLRAPLPARDDCHSRVLGDGTTSPGLASHT